MVRDIHKRLWISSTAVSCRTAASKITCKLSEFLSMDQLYLNIKSLDICSDKKDLLMILSLGKLAKITHLNASEEFAWGEWRRLVPVIG